MYHLVAVIKYRRGILSPQVEATVKQVCLDISDRYEIGFFEIGCDLNHIHFLIQLAPKIVPSSAVQTIKSILARKIFELHPEGEKETVGRVVLV
jgi:REP element-mobilizing transposase RayT